jgi:hypothetical protein
MRDKPKLTSIDGGRKGPPEPPDDDAPMARHHLHHLAIEIMRALARGDDKQNRVGEHMVELAGRIANTRATIGDLVDPVVTEIYERLTSKGDEYDEEMQEIVLAVLQVVAETCASDPAARGRLSNREDRLRRAIEQHVIGHEKRSQKAGWSYLKKLLKEHFGPRSKWDDVKV